MAEPPELSWKPKRKGKIYCAPACGGKCTWAKFQTATRRAKALARRLGKGWKPRVWENLGWHYSAISPCKRIKLHRGREDYSAFLNKPDRVGGLFVGHGESPEEAIRDVVCKGDENLKRACALVLGFDKWR